VKPAGAGHGNVANEPGTCGIALVDMFRIQDGMIAEHWDILQDVPETTANGNDMFSTVSEPRTSEPGPRMAGTSWPRSSVISRRISSPRTRRCWTW
jgi:hypothetical protein